ncbi:MAG: hypothetical protein K2X03_01510 [Bryobacteraceae bacterium]|nr:hypothetical protein [Bryobacteraceae bacterium]
MRAASLHEMQANPWQRGVAFGLVAELRWVRRQGGWHLVYVSDTDSVLEGSQNAVQIEPDDPPEGTIHLRGRRDGQVYLDGRIPGDIHYPFADQLAANHIPALRTRHYRFPGEGQRLSRLVEPVGIVPKEAS